MLLSFAHKAVLCLGAALLLLLPAVVWGQAPTNYYGAYGTEYAVAGALSGDQVMPDFALNARSGFIVWQDLFTDGNGLGISASLLAPGYTIPAVIANEFREATSIGLHRSALLALAVLLMLIALFLAAASRMLVRNTAERFAIKQADVTTPLETP